MMYVHYLQHYLKNRKLVDFHPTSREDTISHDTDFLCLALESKIQFSESMNWLFM